MTDDPALEALRDAIQSFLRSDTSEDRIVTAFLLTAESVTLHNGDENYVNLAGAGSYATRVGLAHISLHDTLEGDDDE